VAKFKRGDIVHNHVGDEFEVIMTESSTGRIALQDLDYPDREPFKAHEKDYEK